MENSYALVLTGSVLPGFAPESVWPALAAYFRMEPDKFNQQLLARAPLTIKQSDDLGKLQTLQAGTAAVGAEAEICAPDGRPGLFVLLDNAPRGPVPRVFVEERMQHGLWHDSIHVAEVGTREWKPFRELDGVMESPVPPPATADLESGATEAVVAQPLRVGDVTGMAAADMGAADSGTLPPGGAIHAGFWRRCAAYVIDAMVAGAIGYALQLALLPLMGAGMSMGDEGSMAAVMAGTGLLAGLGSLVVQWLYFALQESSAAQATLGKRALGLKVVDEHRGRIGFGRASGRFFGKILSSLVFMIGYMLAGWTERKQALHDMLASTFVVFRDVAPGEPLPTVRPPMPWYGWLLNILLFGGFAMVLGGMYMFAASLLSVASGTGSSATGF